uniref:Uncharacterized protein n=1 Tax=Romanomermis culicivorax TaxID=13658 RepID=A0A915L918_ROMCU
MGYFSNIQGADLTDQVTNDLIKTRNILIAGHDYDRFYVLFMAKTVVSERLTDPNLNEATLVQLIQHFENNLLCVKMKTGQLGSNSNEQLTEENFVVDATFNGAKGAQIYNALFSTFLSNLNPVSNEEILKFTLSKENFLYFVYGALQYNYKQMHSIKITPIYHGSYLEKLAVLEYDQKKWVTDSPPIIFEAQESFDEASVIQTAAGIDDLPIDFLSNSKFALINKLFFGPANNMKSAKLGKNKHWSDSADNISRDRQ